MPQYKKYKSLAVGLLVLGGFGFAPAVPAGAFTVKSAHARLQGNRVVVSAALDLDPGNAVEQALTSGIPLDILIEFAVLRKRTFLWDARLGRWTLRVQVKYHPLSGLYIVTMKKNGVTRSFATQRMALKYIGTLDHISLPLPGSASHDATYKLKLRVRMDIEALPLPLRAQAYLTAAWHLNSDWTLWNVRPSSAT